MESQPLCVKGSFSHARNFGENLFFFFHCGWKTLEFELKSNRKTKLYFKHKKKKKKTKKVYEGGRKYEKYIIAR